MEDQAILSLYQARSEQAIAETANKYGSFCYSIAYNVLDNREDAEESVNDTYLDAWNAIPPQVPAILSAFLGKITRRISIDRWRSKTADKRGGGQVVLALEELSECIPSARTVEQELEGQELTRAINRFLDTLPFAQRDLFVCRYWYLESISQVSRRFHFSESKTKSMLYRIRQKLLIFLEQEGMYEA